jgi:hypothetical protein
MSNGESKDESTDDSEQQSEEQPTESEQPAEQADEQPADSEQSEGQPAEETDQPAEQSDDQSPGESDQAEQSDQVADLGGEQADIGDGRAGENLAEDTVAVAGGAGATKVSGRNLKVIAEFTEEGQKFIGDILIHVFESDNGQQGRFLFPTGGQFWQDTVKKGNVITSPTLRAAGSEILIVAHARVLLSTGDYQIMDRDFVLPMPSGDTLRAKFDLTEADVEKTVNAPDADAAKAMVYQSPQLKGHLVLGDLKAEPIGNQRFRVTGKFLSGDISLL